MEIKTLKGKIRIFGIMMATTVLIHLTYAQSKLPETDIIDPKARLEEVFAGGEGRLLEGPAMSPDGILFFTDITFTHIEGMTGRV